MCASCRMLDVSPNTHSQTLSEVCGVFLILKGFGGALWDFVFMLFFSSPEGSYCLCGAIAGRRRGSVMVTQIPTYGKSRVLLLPESNTQKPRICCLAVTPIAGTPYILLTLRN